MWGGDYTNCAWEHTVINNRRSIERTGLEKILGAHLSEKRGMERDGLRERQSETERETVTNCKQHVDVLTQVVRQTKKSRKSGGSERAEMERGSERQPAWESGRVPSWEGVCGWMWEQHWQTCLSVEIYDWQLGVQCSSRAHRPFLSGCRAQGHAHAHIKNTNTHK